MAAQSPEWAGILRAESLYHKLRGNARFFFINLKKSSVILQATGENGRFSRAKGRKGEGGRRREVAQSNRKALSPSASLCSAARSAQVPPADRAAPTACVLGASQASSGGAECTPILYKIFWRITSPLSKGRFRTPLLPIKQKPRFFRRGYGGKIGQQTRIKSS